MPTETNQSETLTAEQIAQREAEAAALQAAATSAARLSVASKASFIKLRAFVETLPKGAAACLVELGAKSIDGDGPLMEADEAIEVVRARLKAMSEAVEEVASLRDNRGIRFGLIGKAGKGDKVSITLFEALSCLLGANKSRDTVILKGV